MKKTWIVLALLFTTQVMAAKPQLYKENFPGGVYIVDGDTPVADLDQLDRILDTRSSNKLIINTLAGGVLDLWNETQRFELSYCISDTFGENKELVQEAIKEATSDWMKVANVKFIYLADQDHNCTAQNEMVLFDINPTSSFAYLARAFFPGTKRAQRNILISKSSYRYDYTAFVGFIRHEFGHVLGFRHEHVHTDAVGGCREDDNFKPVTDYDSNSVMHYPHCGGTNDIEDLSITATDAEGAAIVYP